MGSFGDIPGVLSAATLLRNPRLSDYVQHIQLAAVNGEIPQLKPIAEAPARGEPSEMNLEDRDEAREGGASGASLRAVMACFPTCVSDENPARHEPTTYTEYMLWFGSLYPNIKAKPSEKVATVN